MFVPLVKFYVDYFMDESKKDRYLLLRSSVCVSVLNGMYSRFLSDSGIVPFENIGFGLKRKLVSKAFPFHEDPVQKRRAAIAAYCLTLITCYE